ncbi:hypothetical protein GCM10028773_50810 [Spirosoma koreense]
MVNAVADRQNFTVVYLDPMTANQIVRFNYYADDAPSFGTVTIPDSVTKLAGRSGWAGFIYLLI